VWSLLDVPPAEGESLAIVWMEFESGARGLLEGSYWGPTGMFDDGIEVVGGDGVLRLGGLEAITWGYRSDAPMEMYRNREWKPVNVDFVDWEETVILSVKAFLKALDQGNKVPATGEDGRENVRLIQAAYDNASFLGSFTRPSLRA
jgi:predicted dehydrogenase